MQFDLPLEALRAHVSAVDRPDDFDRFWSDTIAEARSHDRAPEVELIDLGLDAVDTYDVSFPGFGGHPIRAWLRVPRVRPASGAPIVVQFHGYSGGRGWALDPVLWPLAGYAHLSVDTRGQGLGRMGGATPDPVAGFEGEIPGWMTKGIRDPETAYYRRVFTDAVRAVDAARVLPGVDGRRIAVEGTSQGGGMALAVAGLRDDVSAVIAAVPFLCDIETAATRLTDADPYNEVVRYLRLRRDMADAVHRTLGYIDVVNQVRSATAPALFSVALMDRNCPPRTVFGAFNAYGATDKSIEVYPYNDHEGGEAVWERTRLDWLRRVLPPRPPEGDRAEGRAS